MSDPLPGVSVREAAIQLGTSESDVRRRIKRGELAAESLARPGGTLLRVLLPAENGAAPEPHQDTPAADRALSILEALLLANADTFERQADEIGALRERAARAETERDLLRDEITRLRRPWWKRLLH